MKKTIKIFFAVFMSVLIVCFSCVTAFADTTVDDTQNINNKEFFSDLFSKANVDYNKILSLSSLPVDDYFCFLENQYSYGNYINRLCFIPTTGFTFVRKDVTESEYNQYISSNTRLAKDNEIVLLCISFDTGEKAVRVIFNSIVYVCNISSNKTEFNTIDGLQVVNAFGFFCSYSQKTSGGLAGHYFYNNSKVNNLIKNFLPHTSYIKSFPYTQNDYNSTDFVSNFFVIISQLIPGYTGSVSDNSLDTILSKYGKDCDNSILKQYKYQITYLQNNDIKMMFLNNNKAPQYQSTVYKGLYENAFKYKFTYQNTYDAVIYFPQYHKYLAYDDWYNNKTEPNEFKWFWEKDNKSFSLISDWTVTKSESGVSYSGTRVVLSWDNTNSSAKASLTKPWNVDTDNLKEKGWKEGRPTDQNYPYCVDYYINNAPCFSVYFNSKPRVEVDRLNAKQCTYKIQMVTQCGYVYSHFANMYFKFDYTTKINDEKDILEKAQNSFWVWFNEYGAEMDDNCKLHLYENYKGDDNFYIGYRVFFNWDITTNWGNSNPNDDFDYSSVVRDGSKYVDSDGHLHGGSLGNYDNEDLNKFNDNGSGSASGGSDSSSKDFDFSFDGIKSYCSEFFSFIQACFAVFPSFVWLLVGVSLSVLIALRILGR